MKIRWNLEGTPLQIKTDSALGSGEEIRVLQYGKDGRWIGWMGLRFSSQIQYRIYYCNSFRDLTWQPSAEVEKIWTITKTETALTITCNGVEVLNYLFAESLENSCVTTWGDDVVENIEFDNNEDTASDFYKASMEFNVYLPL